MPVAAALALLGSVAIAAVPAAMIIRALRGLSAVPRWTKTNRRKR